MRLPCSCCAFFNCCIFAWRLASRFALLARRFCTEILLRKHAQPYQVRNLPHMPQRKNKINQKASPVSCRMTGFVWRLVCKHKHTHTAHSAFHNPNIAGEFHTLFCRTRRPKCQFENKEIIKHNLPRGPGLAFSLPSFARRRRSSAR